MVKQWVFPDHEGRLNRRQGAERESKKHNGSRNPRPDRNRRPPYPLADAAHPPAMKFVNISGKAFNTIGPSDYTFWEAMNYVIQHEPSDAMDPITLGYFASLGIEN